MAAALPVDSHKFNGIPQDFWIQNRWAELGVFNLDSNPYINKIFYADALKYVKPKDITKICKDLLSQC